jgi:hypothetical protein
MASAQPRQYGSTTQSDNLKDNPKPAADVVGDFHTNDDLDATAQSHHHSLGSAPSQASPGSHTHDGSDSLPLLSGTTLTGSRGGIAALTSIVQALVKLGATDNTTP